MSQRSASKERATKALKEMKNCGFPSDKTKIVLKSLLKTYDHNWEYIEQNNYSTLVDALIAHDEDQGFIQKKIDTDDDGDLEKKEDSVIDDTALDRKRTRSALEKSLSHFQDGGSSVETSMKKQKLEGEQNSGGAVDTLPLQVLPNNDGAGAVSCSAKYKGKEIAVYDEAQKLNGQVTPRALQIGKRSECNENKIVPHSKGPKDVSDFEPLQEKIISKCTLNSSSNEHSDPDYPSFETPIAVIHPQVPAPTTEDHLATSHPTIKNGKSLVSSAENDTTITSGQPSKKNVEIASSCQPSKKNVEIASSCQPSKKNVEIASSSKGEVKLSLTLEGASLDTSLPSLESLLRAVEEKCLKSYKIIQPDFSLKNLMGELCQTVLELSEVPEKESLVNITPTVDALKNTGVPDAFRGVSTSSSPTTLSNETLSMVSVPQYEAALGDIRPLHDVNDISKGEERVRVSLVNDVNSKQYPASFFYIPKNVVYQNGHVNFSLARIGDEDCCADCFGDCLSASVPCACARETGGQFAYTSDGLVRKDFLDDCISRFHDPKKCNQFYCKDCPIQKTKNEVEPSPCKGHTSRKFIKECWVKCGCNKQCGNRVVQRGITCNLQVFLTADGKGWGLRTLDELPRGTFICEYVGEVLTNMEMHERIMKASGNSRHLCPVYLDAYWPSEGVLKDEEALCLDSTFYGNISRYINHRCYDSNLIEIPVEIESPDRHYYHLAFFTTRKVEAFEELTWDYGIDFDDASQPVKAFPCLCGSRYCRNKKKSARSKSRASVSK